MRTRALAVVAIATLVVATPAVATADTGAKITMPELSGRHPVGTSELHLVDQRPDPWQPTGNRELMVTVSYPTDRPSAGERAPWMTPGVAAATDALAASPYLLDVPPGSVDWGSTLRRARTDAPVARGDWPVVLFSPGLGSARELNAGLGDDLASRGYVVVSLSHTHESAVVEFPGGRVVPSLIDTGDTAQRKTAIDVRVADTRFVLDQLGRIARGHNPDAEQDPLPRGLGRALDLSRIGMFGHSYGGYTAGETMVQDRRIDAGINVDGAMAYGSDPADYRPGEIVTRGVDRPFMLVGGDFVDEGTGARIEHSHRTPEFDRTWADFWPNQRGWKRDLHLDRSTHYSFTDLQFAVPQLGGLLTPEKQRQLVGAIDATRSLAAQHDYFAAYFDLHLKGRDTRLFRGDSPRYPDVRFIP